MLCHAPLINRPCYLYNWERIFTLLLKWRRIPTSISITPKDITNINEIIFVLILFSILGHIELVEVFRSSQVYSQPELTMSGVMTPSLIYRALDSSQLGAVHLATSKMLLRRDPRGASMMGGSHLGCRRGRGGANCWAFLWLIKICLDTIWLSPDDSQHYHCHQVSLHQDVTTIILIHQGLRAWAPAPLQGDTRCLTSLVGISWIIVLLNQLSTTWTTRLETNSSQLGLPWLSLQHLQHIPVMILVKSMINCW